MRHYTYILGTILLAAVLVFPASDVFAQEQQATNTGEQEQAVLSGGVGPGSSLYFFDRIFEKLGGLFVMSQEARAERFMRLAEERLAEAQESGEDSNSVRKALEFYDQQRDTAFENASSSQDEGVIGRVASATTRHLSVLDRVAEQVPEEARESVLQAKERSMRGQLSALDALSRTNPNKAAQISSEAAENRLEAAQNRAESGRDDDDEVADVEAAVEEFQRYSDFGKRMSSLAEGIESGTTTPEEVVEEATQHHVRVLEDIHDQVPPQGRAGIQRAIQGAERENAPDSTPPQPGGIPSDADETRGSGSTPAEEGEATTSQTDTGSTRGTSSDSSEDTQSDGGPPEDIPTGGPGN